MDLVAQLSTLEVHDSTLKVILLVLIKGMLQWRFTSAKSKRGSMLKIVRLLKGFRALDD
jgi:hypothetical protein